VVGFAGPVGMRPCNFALIRWLSAWARDARFGRGEGRGVAGTLTGRSGPALFVIPAPGRGPGDSSPFGPGVGAVPWALAWVAPVVGLGLGTPATFAGAAEACGPGGVVCLGAAVARATGCGLGEALAAAAGAGVAGALVGADVGTAFAFGSWVGAADGAAEGAADGGTLIVTATAAALGTLTGTAGTWKLGVGSIDGWVGCGFGWLDACGTGGGFGVPFGVFFLSSCRFCGCR
jgi:hypothetical protein